MLLLDVREGAVTSCLQWSLAKETEEDVERGWRGLQKEQPY